MSDAILNALAGEDILHSNNLATVTLNCLVIRDGLRGARMVVSTGQVTGMRKIVSSSPALLVISCGLLTIAAAAYASKQGLEISIILALLAALFVMGYFGTRRGAVLFLMPDDRIQTVKGTPREATSIIRAVSRVRGTNLEIDGLR